MLLACLGPNGSYTQQAALNYDKNAKLIFFNTINDVINAVKNKDTDEGIIPIENSIEGIVNATLDGLAFEESGEIYIKHEIILPISQNILVHRNFDSTKNKITKFISHPQGLSQARTFLDKNYPNSQLQESTSTAAAAKIVADDILNSDLTLGAIASLNTAEIYNLIPIHKNVQSTNDNKTSFVIIGKNCYKTPECLHKTSLVFSMDSKPGSLLKILDIFSIWDLNLSEIVSRPLRNKSGQYIFFVKIENYENAQDVLDALKMVQRKTTFYKLLGSYLSHEIL